MERKADLRQGTILGQRYSVISILGQGGMGSVYLVEDLKLRGKLWAAKQTYHQAGDYQQFIDEAEMLIKLDHPNIPGIADYFPPDEDGASYLIMEYIKGRTLAELFVSAGRQVPDEDVVHYARQICDLFEYLHAFEPDPIIYRDLKPSNIMIDEQRNVKLIDFGIARTFTFGQEADTVQIGTVGFAAPEQYENKQTDHRTDLYTLGAVMYFLLSGGSYWYTSRVPVSHIRQDLPDELVYVIHKLLADDPEDRFQRAADVKLLLTQKEEKPPPAEASAQTTARLMQRKLVVVGGLYEGVGTTFVTLALSGLLQRYHVPHVVVEYPRNQPEYYYLLRGDVSMPEQYRFPADDIMNQERRSGPVWQDGVVQWAPINPNKLYEDWNSEHMYQLLFALKQPIVLIDAGCSWEDPTIRKLCDSVDDIVLVADSLPSKFNRPLSQERFKRLIDLKRTGKSISIVGNKDIKRHGRGEWIRSLPFEPVACVPYIPYEEIIGIVWKGKQPHEEEDVMARIAPELLQLALLIVPDLLQSPRRKKSFWRNFFQR
ncbi:serine/threonine protein kinase [Paenibacillus athensensis]|uniref:non-specific serine/threonine protein kinase n=1 Tax=Paenibacillus athensensis TaxID=1967502 RepID=A0A4Y8Q8B2_9BACL|nr:serine/threonine-protein kinase [Paenibacillus athensensis]MCD1260374.1 serine/threonine protein kinase [Paenibacillus athensensis]